jgi:glycosyltransferase involved in cell wall biosynthesis
MNERPGLLYIVSDIDMSLHFEWVSDVLSQSYSLSFILIGQKDSALERYLKRRNVSVQVVEKSSRISLVQAWFKVWRQIRRVRPEIVHTHLWIANLIGLTASWLLRVPKRIYTRHHAMVHYDEHPSGRKFDRLCNALATHIIAISDGVRDILIEKDKAAAAKVYVIPHGFDFAYFQNVDQTRIEEVRKRHNIDIGKHPVIGVISRYTRWKGIQYTIPAFRLLRQEYPHAHLILANAHGDYAAEIKQMLSTLPSDSYTEIRFEQDLVALYQLFDVFVHVPVDRLSEAFGQTYVEPLIVGVPCVFTKSGIAHQFVEHLQNAYVVSFRNVEEIHEGMREILTNDSLRDSLISTGKRSVESFTLQQYLVELRKVYDA